MQIPLYLFFFLYQFGLSPAVAHSLGFTDCIHMVWFNVPLCPLCFLQIGSWIQRPDRPRLRPQKQSDVAVEKG